MSHTCRYFSTKNPNQEWNLFFFVDIFQGDSNESGFQHRFRTDIDKEGDKPLPAALLKTTVTVQCWDNEAFSKSPLGYAEIDFLTIYRDRKNYVSGPHKSHCNRQIRLCVDTGPHPLVRSRRQTGLPIVPETEHLRWLRQDECVADDRDWDLFHSG